MSATIFLSYSWEDKIEADKVDNFLTGNGYYVRRDIREAYYKRNIKEFMKSIGDSDYVIPLISDTMQKFLIRLRGQNIWNIGQISAKI